MHQPSICIDRSPYVILNDFGGAFAMGTIGGGIWHGIKGARNSPRVRSPTASAWNHADHNLLFVTRTAPLRSVLHLCPSLSCFAYTGRALGRIIIRYQSPSARARWELWCLGRIVLDVRLRSEGLQAKGGPVERYHLWFPHGRHSGRPR